MNGCEVDWHCRANRSGRIRTTTKTVIFSPFILKTLTHYAESLTSNIDVYRAMDDDRIVGFKLFGVSTVPLKKGITR